MNDIATGVRYQFGQSTRRLEMITENLANAKTPGYRSGEVLAAPVPTFGQVLDTRVAADHERDATDMTQGPIRMTDRPLDFAIDGQGFFVVQAGNQHYLTRNGQFDITQEGTLVASSGHAVLGDDDAPLRIPAGVALERVSVGQDGELQADGRLVGRFRIDHVPEERHLRRVGTTLFDASDDHRQPAESARILGRSLESSNTVVFQELSNLMLLTRSVEALQRAQSSEAQAQSRMIEALSA